ncbi:MAG TPA: membrane-bound PQQ-dependent dehydrogenase, glucose/quinate/shikimate family [Vicinamibacterales bacterium]|nr:membrane-bound PQQ-dependent dehydrogenase, glucose/quinate/shikimate family [Vicinamibacterales bacterium]
MLGLIGVGLAIAGAWLVALSGSAYYLLVGIAYAAAAILAWRGHRSGAPLVAAVALLTVPWALWESGPDFWALFPRLMAPFALAALALFLVPPAGLRTPFRAAAGVLSALFLAGLALAFVPHGVVAPPAEGRFAVAAGSNEPQDWSAYGRTTQGLRYSPFTRIKRDNVAKLGVAWIYRTGDTGPGIDQNTPLQIGDTVYTCSRNNRVAALDADTGKPRWTFDPKASSPIWQRCRGLGYHRTSDVAGAANAACRERIIETTIDARLIALDARTGQPCTEFGDRGSVQLSRGMGEVKPGFYFQTSAPLVARDYVVVGGWVLDNQERGEPSGVIRAFDARSGALVWAWDLGNPAITGLPPEGETYTRGTPNMWSTASYDDRLGLIYLPLGNGTPDYFGVGRPQGSDEYNSALVALDVMTGRERWHFRTVHHDIWDYDLPSQPALIDLSDGRGGTTPAVLQATKRGQIFLLNRETGEPLADVAEKPVTRDGAAPEEKLSATQPYSVGMPTIGAARLSEQKMWGMTMFDQLACRIAFKKLRYDGDFTPIGLTPAIEQPGNAGGMNWGSVSVDVKNQLVFFNDIRIPSVFRLLRPSEYEDYAKAGHATDGHGPSPQRGTPYAMSTDLWMSALGVPCVQPPFGTVGAVDLRTRTIAWQVPAGTAEQLGPLGIPLGLPMPIGVPTYAGTSTTAGGLVFFAGSQDFHIRAYDAETGKELWKHELPVGASATPMTYVSPATGRQYVVVSVGGAAHSARVGDYVIAFALPDGTE